MQIRFEKQEEPILVPALRRCKWVDAVGLDFHTPDGSVLQIGHIDADGIVFYSIDKPTLDQYKIPYDNKENTSHATIKVHAI